MGKQTTITIIAFVTISVLRDKCFGVRVLYMFIVVWSPTSASKSHQCFFCVPEPRPDIASLQEQLTAVRGFAKQEATEVEASTLEKLEELKQDYEVEVEQLASDLTVSKKNNQTMMMIVIVIMMLTMMMTIIVIMILTMMIICIRITL